MIYRESKNRTDVSLTENERRWFLKTDDDFFFSFAFNLDYAKKIYGSY